MQRISFNAYRGSSVTHYDNLLKKIPNLAQMQMLDVGASFGDFMLDVISKGGSIVGIEIDARRVAEAESKGLTVFLDSAERGLLSFRNYGFINCSEVLEHCDDPYLVVQNIACALKSNGYAYITVSNRLGIRDPHFKLYFINWMPRFLAEKIITWLGKDKDYTHLEAGEKKLSKMHYMTSGEFKHLLRHHGLKPLTWQIPFRGTLKYIVQKAW